jgi:hypothetical protein
LVNIEKSLYTGRTLDQVYLDVAIIYEKLGQLKEAASYYKTYQSELPAWSATNARYMSKDYTRFAANYPELLDQAKNLEEKVNPEEDFDF